MNLPHLVLVEVKKKSVKVRENVLVSRKLM